MSSNDSANQVGTFGCGFLPHCRRFSPALALLVGILVIGSATIGSPIIARAQSGALEATQDLVNQALRILGNKQAPLVQRRRELRDLLIPRFDFTEMSRSALGYHWRSLDPQQRTDFTQVFTGFIQAAYLAKVQDYSGQQVQYGQARSLGQNYAAVDTKIVQSGKSPINVNYLLEQTAQGWKVYDVAVDNISIIANYRTQFNRVINQQGFPKLMADLRAKQQQLGSELGQG